MSVGFIRRSFYIDPPAADASPKEWHEWQKQDDKKAAAHKRAVTMSQEHAETPEELQATAMRKVGGVWKQAPATGIKGNEDEGYQVEPSEKAKQEHHIALIDMESTRNKRGGSRVGKSARRRKNRKKKK